MRVADGLEVEIFSEEATAAAGTLVGTNFTSSADNLSLTGAQAPVGPRKGFATSTHYRLSL